MNEQFKEIAKQAGYHPDVYELCKPGMEKFAELIVRECVAVCWAENGPESGTDAGRALKEHFGIEE